jgi:hypothetical protein
VVDMVMDAVSDLRSKLKVGAGGLSLALRSNNCEHVRALQCSSMCLSQLLRLSSLSPAPTQMSFCGDSCWRGLSSDIATACKGCCTW